MVKFIIYLLIVYLTTLSAAYTLCCLFAAGRIWAKWLTLTQGVVRLQVGSYMAGAKYLGQGEAKTLHVLLTSGSETVFTVLHLTQYSAHEDGI